MGDVVPTSKSLRVALSVPDLMGGGVPMRRITLISRSGMDGAWFPQAGTEQDKSATTGDEDPIGWISTISVVCVAYNVAYRNGST